MNTSRDAVFAGSMQLLAGIKLCTGRTITNHPHYEDKKLRDRTKQVGSSESITLNPFSGRGLVPGVRCVSLILIQLLTSVTFESKMPQNKQTGIQMV